MAPAAIGSRRERRRRIASAAAGSDPLVSARGCLHAQRLKRARDGKLSKSALEPGHRLLASEFRAAPAALSRHMDDGASLIQADFRAQPNGHCTHVSCLRRGTAHRSSSLTRTSTRRRGSPTGTFKRTISAGTATINFLDHRPRRSVPKNRLTTTLGPLTAREGREKSVTESSARASPQPIPRIEIRWGHNITDASAP